MERVKDAKYTTHCLRRGGAQHRFLFAKERWTLTDIKNWGGWARGDSQGTIIRYLLNDYVARETDSTFLCSPFYRPSKFQTSESNDDQESELSQIVSKMNII
jgi:hypothetical protein